MLYSKIITLTIIIIKGIYLQGKKLKILNTIILP